ncbi:sigma-54-dependent Fis family transcriptional regulator (plasmid) [Paroceanicella profunda]|uniref:Nif-specific regulatory protein n=1 Tax=Paroceanicella profunda TaxID=2579971 RepID=A0A5B8FJ84_9RHOB|nr:sigma-54 dependent transcriptional regulator [Paroceanicella profunda]QDL94157.1 sigma-54-dependent Fis family transcriptional regulator [Paroceanicella profunda]
MTEAGPLLLIEDTPSLSMVYRTILSNAGFRVTTAFTAAEGVSAFDADRNRVVLLDLMLPDADGLDVLRHISACGPDSKVIVITANGSINRAVEAMREGAFDFLVKPFDDRRLLSAVHNAREATLSPPPRPGAPEDGPQPGAVGFEGFVGSSPLMHQIYRTVGHIGRSTATVFITGESGTGKEVCAQAIHNISNRRKGPFVPLNCGAIPRDLLESEVFGHLRGSFTGAIADKQGAAAVADGGTLFLDEVCEMDLALQTKLLRFLQTSMIQPVGAVRQRKVDVRIVCATNRDPAAEVRAGRFREDLFYRLHVVPIHLPPLRDRGEDVNEIAQRCLVDFAREEGRRFTSLSQPVRDIFRALPWPGNVRQLLNVMRNIVVLHDGTEVLPEMLPPELRLQSLPRGAPGVAGAEAPPAPQPSVPVTSGALAVAQVPAPDSSVPGRADEAIRTLVGLSLAEMEREFIEATIAACKGSIPRAARMLDVSPSTLYRKREGWARSGS